MIVKERNSEISELAEEFANEVKESYKVIENPIKELQLTPTNIFTVFVKKAIFTFRDVERNVPNRLFQFRSDTVRNGFRELFEMWENIHKIDIVNKDGDKIHIDLTKEMRGDI
jgi:hypothetical protein